MRSGAASPGEVVGAETRAVPTVAEWLRVNLAIGTLSFGSASRIVLYEDAVVRARGWLSDEEFAEVLTVAQLLPGPNLVNLSAYLGYRLVGPLASVLGIVCLCLPGSLLAVALSSVLALERPWVQAPLSLHIGNLDLDRERALQLPVVTHAEWALKKK